MAMNTASPKDTVMVEQKVVNLALQGGGSHGAFTWGVLDRLLEEERLSFEGITASSAGSVNAAVLAHGLAVGGRDEARRALQCFWKRMSETTAHGVLQPSLLDRMKGNFGLEYSPGYRFVDALMYFTSPDFFNPLNHNPIRTVLEEIVDFERLRQNSAPMCGPARPRSSRLERSAWITCLPRHACLC
jgi:NTE family protein